MEVAQYMLYASQGGPGANSDYPQLLWNQPAKPSLHCITASYVHV
jgi:hypothetical protein